MAHSINLFGMLIYKHITVRFHKQYKSVYKYYMYIVKNRIFCWASIFTYFMSHLYH